METVLDRNKELAKSVIAEGVVKGKSWDDIAAELSKLLGEEVKPEAVSYFYYREFGSKSDSGSDARAPDDNDLGGFNLTNEMVWLYRVQKRRIGKLVSLEESAGIPFPETSKAIEIGSKILEKLAEISGNVGGTELLDRLLNMLEGGSDESGSEEG